MQKGHKTKKGTGTKISYESSVTNRGYTDIAEYYYDFIHVFRCREPIHQLTHTCL